MIEKAHEYRAAFRALLMNPCKPELGYVEADAQADWGVVHLCIPREIQLRLGLEEVAKKTVMMHGAPSILSYVGPVEVRVKNRICFTGALVMGDQVLLGTIPFDDLGLGNPNRPDAVTK